MFRMILGAYVALAIVASASSAIKNGGAETTGTLVSNAALVCPCGQCDPGCGCCLDADTCVCDTCACSGCDSESCGGEMTALVMATTDAPSCCSSGGTCPMSGDASATELASVTSDVAAGCQCGHCEAGCNCCDGDACDCEVCQCTCESCGS